MIYYDPQASELLKQKWMPQAYVVLNLTNGKVYNGQISSICLMSKGLRADHSGPLKRAVTPSVCGEQK